MDYFPGFAWAVPMAFSDAVSQCRFEEGDILYDSRQAYGEDWDAAKGQITHFVQVKYPEVSRTALVGDHSRVFEANWHSELRLDFYTDHEKSVSQTYTTQGRLYTLLWKGDLGVLDTATSAPEIPLVLRDVTRQIGQVRDAASKVSNGRALFAMASDISNPVSGKKIAKINAALKSYLPNGAKTLCPKTAGLEAHKLIAPSVEITFFAVEYLSKDDLYDLVKKAVYVPTKGTKKDMYNMAKHGAIF